MSAITFRSDNPLTIKMAGEKGSRMITGHTDILATF
jgi:hypothetical protein